MASVRSAPRKSAPLSVVIQADQDRFGQVSAPVGQRRPSKHRDSPAGNRAGPRRHSRRPPTTDDAQHEATVPRAATSRGPVMPAPLRTVPVYAVAAVLPAGFHCLPDPLPAPPPWRPAAAATREPWRKPRRCCRCARAAVAPRHPAGMPRCPRGRMRRLEGRAAPPQCHVSSCFRDPVAVPKPPRAGRRRCQTMAAARGPVARRRYRTRSPASKVMHMSSQVVL